MNDKYWIKEQYERYDLYDLCDFYPEREKKCIIDSYLKVAKDLENETKLKDLKSKNVQFEIDNQLLLLIA